MGVPFQTFLMMDEDNNNKGLCVDICISDEMICIELDALSGSIALNIRTAKSPETVNGYEASIYNSL